MRHMNFHDEKLDSGNVCPACPQVWLMLLLLIWYQMQYLV